MDALVHMKSYAIHKQPEWDRKRRMRHLRRYHKWMTQAQMTKYCDLPDANSRMLYLRQLKKDKGHV